MKIVPLTAAHMDKAWGRQPPVTCHGIAVVDDDQVMGIAALYPDETGCRLILVSFISEAGRTLLYANRARKMLVVACRHILTMAKRWRLPVHAVADPDLPHTDQLLRHLGFTHYREETYQWHGSL